jgi:pyruvate kinase
MTTKLEPRGRKVKILATVGPASGDPDMLRRLFRAGADAFRINLSHGEYQTHAEAIRTIRALEKEFSRPIAVLCDLQGPKLRVGTFKDGQAIIPHGASFTLDRDETPGDASRVFLPHKELFAVLRSGQRLLINDGKIRLRVTEAKKDRIVCTAEVGGVISDRKGVNVPDAEVPIPALTDKDRRDLTFALDNGADWIGLSFVQRPEDLAEARKLMGGRGALCAKIEKPQAVRRLAEIIELSDGVMVARGDLGVELPFEEVPIAQKRIISLCNRLGRPVITATQMLESMITHPRPTRAEASDVANAILDGTDAVMLSAETAAGQYPRLAVEAMSRIILEIEKHPRRQRVDDRSPEGLAVSTEHAIAAAATSAVRSLDAPTLIVFTKSGFSARVVASHRPGVPILVLTDQERTYRQLALVWGVVPCLVRHCDTYQDMVKLALDAVRGSGLARQGDRVVVTAGVPFDVPGTTNLMKVETV